MKQALYRRIQTEGSALQLSMSDAILRTSEDFFVPWFPALCESTRAFVSLCCSDMLQAFHIRENPSIFQRWNADSSTPQSNCREAR